MKNRLKISAIYQLVVGVEILGIWSMLVLSGEVPEMATAPWQIGMHILAEMITGILLLISGLFIMIRGRKHGFFNLSFGALLYTLIASPGYYAHQGKWGIATLFFILLLSAVLLLTCQKETHE